MSILLVDIGNTRVKWVRFEKGQLSPQHTAPHAGWTAKDFSRNLFKSARGIERVIVVSVAAAALERSLSLASRQRCNVTPEFIKTQRRAAGVTTKYEEPWRLGVDRFIAAIGAHHLNPMRPVCVVGIGTAVTIDLIDSRGVHRGGAIIPGPDLMVASLLKDTNGIRRRAAGSRLVARVLFARNTRAALEQGARYAIAAAVDRAMAEAQKILKRKPVLILTGGAAPAVRALIRTPHRFVPDLVLRGLAVAYDLHSFEP